MATALAPVDSRDVVRCDHCKLVQFRTTNNICRRPGCGTSLDEDEPKPIKAAPVVQKAPIQSAPQDLQYAVSFSHRWHRRRLGLSQRELALRMAVPRTYVSKIENGKALPTMSSLERAALGLEVDPGRLVTMPEYTHEDKIEDLLRNELVRQFIAEGVLLIPQGERPELLRQILAIAPKAPKQRHVM